MKEIVLKLSEAENVLREWFEAGIAFNLIFGPLHFRKEFVDFINFFRTHTMPIRDDII